MATNYIICAAQMGTWENFEVHKNPNGVQLFLVTMTFWISLSTPNSALSHKRKRNLEAKIIKFILSFFPKKLKFVTYFPKENKCFVYTNIQKHCDRRHLTLKNSISQNVGFKSAMFNGENNNEKQYSDWLRKCRR